MDLRQHDAPRAGIPPIYALGIGRLGLPAGRLLPAVLFVFQLVGMSTLFFLANLGIGLVCLLAVRGTTGTSVSVYLLNDVTLGVLSAVQGACFECWRTSGGRPAGDGASPAGVALLTHDRPDVALLGAAVRLAAFWTFGPLLIARWGASAPASRC